MPHELPLLKDLLLLLLASVPIAFLFHRLRLPTIVGFMITGVVIGPYGLGLIRDVHAIEALAEIGVVLLLFTIGLEFSLRRIMGMRRLVLAGGGMQVALTALPTAWLAYFWGRPANQAVFFGFLFALSSTAIVLKSYVERAEVDAPHGRAGVGILLFQDLSIVVMMLLVPVLGGREGASAMRIASRSARRSRAWPSSSSPRGRWCRSCPTTSCGSAAPTSSSSSSYARMREPPARPSVSWN